MPLFCMPTSVPVSSTSMNYASVVFAGMLSIAMAWYFVWGKKNYEGPPAVDDEVAERRRSSAHAK